ncbi:hypothetical protein ACFTXM_14920 [Streptomyces sp. NPDC056930]|uniref:hypothetical protein n=1 Tax=Streptomyces sp. NPDC056930 TaxID=3345967 RepID=UPI0036363A25
MNPPFNWLDPAPWIEVEQEFGSEFPAGFCESVNAYGSIEISRKLYLEHPVCHLRNLRETIRGLGLW